MTMDAITEKIAHFIGAFQMIEEEARQRAEYDKFRAEKAAEQDADRLDLASLKAKQSYKLKDFDPKLKLKPLPPDPLKPGPDLSGSAPTAAVSVQSAPIIATSLVDALIATAAFDDPGEEIITFTINPPSSLINITYELARLFDDDTLGQVSDFGLSAGSQFIEVLETVFEAAQNLQPFELDLAATDGNWMMVVTELQQQTVGLQDADFGAADVTVIQGLDATGIFINGEAAEELPDFKDLLPDYFRAQDDAADAAAEIAEVSHDFDADFEGQDSPFKVEDGQTVVAGANSLVNTAAISSNWLDASAIAVSGDYVSLDTISQVNVLIDHDAVGDTLPSDLLADHQSTTMNVAQIVSESTKAAAAKEVASDETTAAVIEDAPENWAVVRHEGPVTQINWVEQYTFTTDFDTAAITSFGAATFIGLGENIIQNEFFTSQTGFVYDAILIGGDLIELNIINQINVLLDSDAVSGLSGEETPVIAEETTPIAEMNGQAAAGVGAASSGIAGEVSPAPAEGAIAQSSQTITIQDDDDDDSDEEDDDADVEEETEVVTIEEPVSTGDNLLYNQAVIESESTDTVIETTEPFAEALEAFADGSDDISDDFADQDQFDGVELLRVLYIDGDFTTVNVIDQVNVLGDSDQVHIARDDFAADLQDELALTTGSNVEANVASIKDHGVDSTVMARGKTYSDALIHQAELVEDGVHPAGDVLSNLASEAVAFLSDDIVAPTLADDIAAQTNSIISDTFSQSDIMQGMLT